MLRVDQTNRYLKYLAKYRKSPFSIRSMNPHDWLISVMPINFSRI